MFTSLLSPQLLALASTFHKLTILVFGYVVPALSSVKAVVRKDSEAYHQWTTYWLILHLYRTILAPFLHLTPNPIFQLVAILWLSLPRFQGASVVYEQIVVPWVDKYEDRVDDAVEDAHRGVKRWVLGNVGRVIWMVMGESGNLAGTIVEGLLGNVLGIISRNDEEMLNTATNSTRRTSSQDVTTLESSGSSLPPRHSVKEALGQSSSFEELAIGEDSKFDNNASFGLESDFYNDFIAMLRQGLYVFANVQMSAEDKTNDRGVVEKRQSIFEGGFKLGVFSYNKGVFVITPAGEHGEQQVGASNVKLPILKIDPPSSNGSQGLVLECSNVHTEDNNMGGLVHIRVEIVLSDESDRDVLLNGLHKCLPVMLSSRGK
mmetsp:Transcript_19018/g.41154  ORF Transcript_19018/g.41154 Transcript_19018/m.41154 type:complete len:375 (+) Transcript_19018:158-1282(+)